MGAVGSVADLEALVRLQLELSGREKAEIQQDSGREKVLLPLEALHVLD